MRNNDTLEGFMSKVSKMSETEYFSFTYRNRKFVIITKEFHDGLIKSGIIETENK